ncbi:MAG: hypothetical protein HY815_27950 [Candidatus Riflebacteria bacterium]|nr:hypothetical protein [Candidatus Riflebacteria bacterium]
MDRAHKIQLREEVKRTERELYHKLSELAAADAMDHHVADIPMISLGVPEPDAEGDKWVDSFSKIVDKIGELSAGGNSVVDVAGERQR